MQITVARQTCGLARTVGVLLATALGWMVSGCGSDENPSGPSLPDAGVLEGGADGAPSVAAWSEADYPYRVQITLKAHPTKDRSAVPVIAAIAHPGASLARDVRVYGKNASGEYTRLAEAGAWSQPEGTVFEVGFTAPGVIKATETRDFLVYYKTIAAPESWTWGSSGSWSQYASPDENGDGKPDYVSLTGGGFALQRDLAQDGSLVRGRRQDGQSFLKLTAPGWTVAEGFSSSYQLESSSETYPASDLEVGPPTRIVSEADASSAAFSAQWQGRSTPVLHDAFLTYRVFSHFPFAESLVSATVGSDLKLSSSDWSGRLLYLSDAYDRMVSDTRGEEPLEKKWDTQMRWLVVYNSATSRAFGWFLAYPGVVRAEESEGKQFIHDSYGYAAGGSSALRYLWMASTSKDTIVELFDAMKPGVTVGDPERRELNILVPKADSYYFPGDRLEVLVSTPGNPQPVTATLGLPNGTKIAVDLAKGQSPLLWQSVSPLLLEATHPAGSWTITAQSAGVEEKKQFEFRLPSHPHLLFSAADLPALQARKNDPAYAAIWKEMLRLAAGYTAPIPDPGPGKDIRGYADRLVNLALIQLMDPAQPYDAMLWNYFFTMLRYPNWDSQDTPFNNLDLTVGHFLTALSLTYDWHYDHLTPAERQETRARLASVTAKWVSTGYLSIYRDIDWSHYGTVTNNHYWINHEGVAAAAFVLADELPDKVRTPWVERTEENLSILLSVLEDDGASNEGVAYHSYGQVNLFQWIDLRDRALGGNTAQSSTWFKQSVQWDLYSLLPGGTDNYGGVANFGDCPPSHYQPPRTVQAWLANRLGDGLAQWTAQSVDRPDITALSYLWYNPSVAAVPPDTLPNYKLFGRKGIFAWRSSWGNDATYFSIKSGSYFGGHEQPDAGHFILHRAGVPYVTDHGYSYLKKSDEHNLVVFDDADQYGGGTQWMQAVDPQHWATIRSVLAEGSYFAVEANPAPMVTATELQDWTREIVAVHPDVFVLRDSIAAGASHKLTWYLHSYKSTPPAAGATTYSYVERRAENPFAEAGTGRWSIQPQDGVPTLRVAELSSASWSAVVEPSEYVPEINPESKAYNDPPQSFQVGYRLARSLQAAQARSTVALWFGDDIEVESWSGAEAEAARFHKSGSDIAVVVWPQSGEVVGFHGWDVTGKMAGRRSDDLAYFGRGLRQLRQSATTLVDASAPVDLYARIEHSISGSDPGVVVVRAEGESTLKLRCPTKPSSAKLDGAEAPVTWAASELTVVVPAGSHRFELR